MTFINNFLSARPPLRFAASAKTVRGERRGMAREGRAEGGGAEGVTSKTSPRPRDRICGWKSAPRWCDLRNFSRSRSVRDRACGRVVVRRKRRGPSNFVVSRSYNGARRAPTSRGVPPDGLGRAKCKIENHSCENDPFALPFPPSSLLSVWRFRQGEAHRRYYL